MSQTFDKILRREWQQYLKMSKIFRMPGIWEISQIPEYIWVWYIFKILEISQMTEISKIPRHLGIPQIPRHLRNFPNTQTFGEFPKYLGFWDTPQIYHLQIPIGIWVIFPNAWESGKLPKCLGIWEISQMPI